MTPERLRELLSRCARGELSVEEAERALRWQPFEDLGFARVDHHRALRQGYPEVIFGEGKTAAQVVEIARRLSDRMQPVLATRLGAESAGALVEAFPDAELDPFRRTAFLPAPESPANEPAGPPLLVVTAGTGDLPVAEEAALTARALGLAVERLTDVGVAGLHRLLGSADTLHRAGVVVVVAGMEGALPSVIGGLVATPVVAVPTSVGYGASFQGLSALLGMLNSCAAGLTVVNIDNGFGAAFAAARILQPGRFRTSAGSAVTAGVMGPTG